MKRFFLLALTAGLLSPIAAKADRYWLILNSKTQEALEKIEVKSLAQCEEQGYIFQSKKNELIKNPQGERTTLSGSWKCLRGK